MKPLIIAAEKNKTPDIEFDGDSGRLEISGMSYAENAQGFYQPVLDWLDEYFNSPAKKTELNVRLKYFNTSSAKCIMDLLERVIDKAEEGENVSINWYYQKYDEDMLSAGENYSELLEHEFNFVEVEDEE